MFAIIFLYLEQGTLLDLLVSILQLMNIKTERAYNEYCSSLKFIYIVESAYSFQFIQEEIFFSFLNKSNIFFYLCLIYEISLYDGLNLISHQDIRVARPVWPSG